MAARPLPLHETLSPRRSGLATASAAFSTALPALSIALLADVESVVGRIAGVDVVAALVSAAASVSMCALVADGIVLGAFVLARGQTEREDRNGHCNLLHDRSTPKWAHSRARARPAE